eukprot:TRINITY_DN13696_c0_g1_i2.p3 TRINITY_DN13696_c0_g1~~TRINITY_DN13696_c0_g1_i2.p3  ORF type:complete len:228 (+),score=3.97 TRINITY_DN13696_c0_g1_i2:942-1625(+)
MPLNKPGSEGKGAKVLIREGNNPDHQLRSLSLYQVDLRWSSHRDSQDVGLEAAIHLKSAQQLTGRVTGHRQQSGIKYSTEAMVAFRRKVGEHSNSNEAILQSLVEHLEKQMQAQVTIRRVRNPPTDRLRFPEQRQSVQGQSGPKENPNGVFDGQQVNIPVLAIYQKVTEQIQMCVLTKQYVKVFRRQYCKASVAQIIILTTSKKSEVWQLVPQTDTGSQGENPKVLE